MNIWELERQIIEIIGVELQVPRAKIGPHTHILDDLHADWLSIDRLIAAFEAQLHVRVYQELFERRVWDVVKECHNRRSGRDSIAENDRARPGRKPEDVERSAELMLALGFRPQRSPGVQLRRRTASA